MRGHWTDPYGKRIELTTSADTRIEILEASDWFMLWQRRENND